MSRTRRKNMEFDDKDKLVVVETDDNPRNCHGRKCWCKGGNSKDRSPLPVRRALQTEE